MGSAHMSDLKFSFPFYCGCLDYSDSFCEAKMAMK